MRFLQLISQLQPKLVIIDSEFTRRSDPLISLIREQTDKPLNATAQFAGQERAVKGVPSRSALKMLADAMGYQLTWSDWDRLAPDDRVGVRDYFHKGGRKLRRATCALRP